MKTAAQAATSAVVGLAALAVLLFLPAGTLSYWQAWVFIAVSTIATIGPSIYLARTNPAALQRRMRAGPTAEARPAQKVIITGAFVSMAAMTVLSALDHRFGWSRVPTAVCWIGEVLVALGLGVAMLVVIQNGYAASTVTVEAGQKVVTSGLYAVVRHPMYVGNVFLMLGIPPALGSYWGLVFFVPGVSVLVWRILDEERLLVDELDGYREYTQRVRYRLLPYVW